MADVCIRQPPTVNEQARRHRHIPRDGIPAKSFGLLCCCRVPAALYTEGAVD